MTTDDSASGRDGRRVTVRHGRHGWEVMELEDDQVVRRANYTDWHRVERRVGILDRRRILDLQFDPPKDHQQP